MPSPITQGFLSAKGADFRTVSHPEAFTAEQTAAASHVPGRQLAKTVIVKLDGQLSMVVVPATCRLDLESVGRSCGVEQAELATEVEFRFAFPDCAIGAMPPLGNLYNLPVYVCSGMARAETIHFNGGSHTQLVSMLYAEFAELAKPTVIDIACGAADPKCRPIR